MSTIIPQGDGPNLGPLSRTEMYIRAEEKMKHLAPSNLPIGTGGFVDLSKNQSKKNSKVFVEGPMPPLSPSQDQNGLVDNIKSPDLFSKKPPFTSISDKFVPGSVLQTSKSAAYELAESLGKIKSGTTGAIVQEGFEPVCNQYTEGIHFCVEKSLAKGAFGTVDICIDSGKLTKKFLRKIIKKENFRSSEVTVPLNLNHENVTKLYGLIQREEQDGQMEVELMLEDAGIALNTFAKKFKVDTQKIWHITKQTMSGLNHMHLYGMIHFDIKPENLCVQWKGTNLLVKITDFGSAKLPQEPILLIGWTPEYMAPETSQLYLQRLGLPFPRQITDADITGKVDVFGMVLVIMFLYEKVHVLQRLISRGMASYTGIDDNTRMKMQNDLMKMLATEPKFVQSIIPDQCDIDMRDLLGNMAQYFHENRYSAKDVLDFIERREKRQMDAILECRKKLQAMERERERTREYHTMPNVDTIAPEVPDIAFNCLEMETGPIKTFTKDKLRQKLQPYPGKGKGKGKCVREETPYQELKKLQTANKTIQTASKTIDEFQPPPTPVTDVSLSMAKLNVKNQVNTMERNSVVTQPMTEEAAHMYVANTAARQQVAIGNRRIQQPTQQPEVTHYGLNRGTPMGKVLPPQQPVPVSPMPGTTSAIKVEPVIQSQTQYNQNIMDVLKDMLKKGQLKFAVSEKGPVLVQLPEGSLPAVPNRGGVVPCVAATPPGQMQNKAPDLPFDECMKEEMGNVPNFLQWC